MYVYKRQVTTQRGIATLLAIALVLWAVGSHLFSTAEAANLTYVRDTLSDSDTGSVSNHTIEFLSPTGVAAGGTITVTFPSTFTGTSSINEDDLDLEVTGTDRTVVDGAPGAGEWGLTWSGNTLTLDADAAQSIASNATVTIKIGLNADTGGPAAAQLTNPSGINSYMIDITAGASDSGTAMVAIVDNVLVTADVPTTLTFTVAGVANALTVNGTTTTETSTSATIPFGTLTSGQIKTIAQDLTLATNARNGYVVTVEQDQNLLSSTGADIDGFIHGAYTNTPTSWSAPVPSISDENTWGHWGLTSDDTNLLGTGIDFGSNQWVSASTTPRAIMAHNGPADGTTDNIGAVRIGYQIQISALQEAGDDYNTTLTYIATPRF
jgi:hypothetical protein